MGKVAKAWFPAWLLLAGCTGHPGKTAFFHSNHYAEGFAIIRESDQIRLTVRNPWEKAEGVEFDYYLIPHDKPVPDSLAGKNIIRIPVRRIICMSTSHIAFFEALGEEGKITGVSGSRYINSHTVQQAIREAKTTDIGYGQNMNFEEVIRQHPDVVMVYGVDSEVTGFLGKFSDLGIPAVLVSEYLEGSPLGRAEWIKFMAAFTGKDEMADSLFRSVEKNYLGIKRRTAGITDLPSVMTGLPYRDTWWVPGGRSYLANLIHDAGGHYIFSDNTSHESFAISMEEAILRSSGVDFWIHTGTVSTEEAILASDTRFSSFPMFSHSLIYNNNKRSTDGGGNDFWESGTVYPDRILADLIRIFHPGLLAADSLTYYTAIK